MRVPAIDHEWRVAHARAVKDDWFRVSPHSPVPARDRDIFGGLTYFPVDQRLRFEGLRLGPLPDGAATRLELVTSDGGSRQARRLGTLAFEIDGSPRALIAYGLGTDDGWLFVPFLDATSGVGTYGAGRYLDIDPEENGTYVVDFNAAYHPYCAYSPDYSCPLTPSENRLPDRIEAGERLADRTEH